MDKNNLGNDHDSSKELGIKDKIIIILALISILLIVLFTFKRIVNLFSGLVRNEYFIEYIFIFMFVLAFLSLIILILYGLFSRITETLLNFFSTIVLIFVTIGFLLISYKNIKVNEILIQIQNDQKELIVDQKEIADRQLENSKEQTIILKAQTDNIQKQTEIQYNDFNKDDQPFVFIWTRKSNKSSLEVIIENLNDITVMQPKFDVSFILCKNNTIELSDPVHIHRNMPKKILPLDPNEFTLDRTFISNIINLFYPVKPTPNYEVYWKNHIDDTKFLFLKVSYRSLTNNSLCSTGRLMSCQVSDTGVIIEEEIINIKDTDYYIPDVIKTIKDKQLKKYNIEIDTIFVGN